MPVSCLSQPEGSHLLSIANEQDVADQYWMVPGFAFDRLEPCDLSELVGRRSDHRQLTLLGQYKQKVLVWQQDELTVAVASPFPLTLAIFEVDACKDAAIKAEGVAFVNDEVIEVGLQPCRAPASFGGPSAWTERDGDAAGAAICAGGNQKVAIC